MEKLLEKLKKVEFNDIEVRFKEWEKYGKHRIYVNTAYGKGQLKWNTVGYIENNKYVIVPSYAISYVRHTVQEEIEKVLEEK